MVGMEEEIQRIAAQVTAGLVGLRSQDADDARQEVFAAVWGYFASGGANTGAARRIAWRAGARFVRRERRRGLTSVRTRMAGPHGSVDEVVWAGKYTDDNVKRVF